jgi:hypothetical protein
MEVCGINNMLMYFAIPESVVREASDAIPDDPNNSFARILRAGKEFRDAGMTPLYILDPNYKDLVVVAQETFKKKLN